MTSLKKTILKNIDFTSFNISVEKEHVNINWCLSNYTENSIYFVERSDNGMNFAIIDTIYSNGININTKDLNPLQGISYYRIRATFPDNKISLSEIRDIEFYKTHSDEPFEIVKAYPSPFQQNLSLIIACKEEMSIEIKIIDQTGKVHTNTNEICHKGEHCLNLSKYFENAEIGSYHILLNNGIYQKTKSIHIVKEKEQ